MYLKKVKINLSKYLKSLNDKVDYINSYRLKNNCLNVEKLTCKSLAKKINVTPSTLTNLNTDSKFSLISNIVEKIYLHYYPLFIVCEENERRKYPDEFFCYDYKFILYELTSFYAED